MLSHLRPLVGQGSASGSQEEAFTAWRRFFEALADEHPLVLVFEDIQWADDGLLDFIEHLVDWVRDVPLLILCTARLELLERRPAWGGGKVNAATVALSPLTDEDTAKLISALGERALLQAETQSALLERAGGNPLYAEQYVRMLAERGSTTELPETVQGIIAARLDSLPAGREGTCSRMRRSSARSFGSAHSTRRSSSSTRCSRRSSSSARAGARSRGRPSTRSSISCCGTLRTDRFRVPTGRRNICEPQGGSRRSGVPRITPRWSRTTTRTRSSSCARRGREVGGISQRARAAFVDAGARAGTLHALPAADRYYADALELTPEGDPARADLLFRLGQIRWFRFEQGGAGARGRA